MKLVIITSHNGTNICDGYSGKKPDNVVETVTTTTDGIAVISPSVAESASYMDKVSKVLEAVKNMPDNLIVVSIEKDRLTSYLGSENVRIKTTPQGILITNVNEPDASRMSASAAKDYERRKWGEYRVLDRTDCGNGLLSLTKRLSIEAGKSISYQLHNCRSEVWTIVKGQGVLILDGHSFKVGVGQTINIGLRQLHTIKAISDLEIIEVQLGAELREDDIERFDWNWDTI